MLSLSQRQSLSQRLSPQQVQYLKMLQLPVIALEQRIKQEMEINPMLEELNDLAAEVDNDQDTQVDDDSPLTLTETNDPGDDATPDREEVVLERERDMDWDELIPEDNDGYKAPSFTGADMENQDELPQRAEQSFAERLLEQLRMQVTTDDELALAEEIIGNIDDDGYLRRDLGEIVDDLNKFLAATRRRRNRETLLSSNHHDGHISGSGHFDAYEDVVTDAPFGRDRLLTSQSDDDDYGEPPGAGDTDDDDLMLTGQGVRRANGNGHDASQREEKSATAVASAPISLEEMSHLSIEELAMLLERGTSAFRAPAVFSNPETAPVNSIQSLSDLESEEEELEYAQIFTLEEAQRILHRIQRLDPPAIGAANLQECLAIQLEMESHRSPAHELASRIIRETYSEFTMKHFEKICHRLDCTTDELKQAIDVIRTLNPKPGEGSVAIVNDNYLTPDFVIERDQEDFVIVPNDRHIPILRINKAYQEMMRRKGGKKQPVDRDTRKFLREKFEAAKWFIASIHQRRQTMMKVMRAIVDLQMEFFLHGPDRIRPMIYKDVAERIGMDISTVCRVVNGKYTQTDYGTFELRYFFSEKLETTSGEEVSTKIVKARIQELIDSEDKAHPLSDDALSKSMRDAGYNVARRTVAKYREQLNIPVARLRRAL